MAAKKNYHKPAEDPRTIGGGLKAARRARREPEICPGFLAACSGTRFNASQTAMRRHVSTISQDLEVKARRWFDSRFVHGHRRGLLQIVGRPEAISDPVR
jgi:hypothetical protein